MQFDLLDYPQRAGFKSFGTSKDAAQAVTPKIKVAHQLILDALHRHGPMTPDEIAQKIDRSILFTRPRLSEMRKLGLLHPTGEKRKNESGLWAEVLSA